MSITSLESTFLTNPFTSTFRPKRKATTFAPPYPCTLTISSKYSPDDNKDSTSSCKRDENQLAKLALVTLAAGMLTLGSVDPASAAKTGGRVGGQAFKSPAPPRSSPRINNSRTNVYINPPVAPPLVGGYGYGYGVPFYGGWGWSPFSYFAPGPGVAIGVGGGFDSFALFLFWAQVLLSLETSFRPGKMMMMISTNSINARFLIVAIPILGESCCVVGRNT